MCVEDEFAARFTTLIKPGRTTLLSGVQCTLKERAGVTPIAIHRAHVNIQVRGAFDQREASKEVQFDNLGGASVVCFKQLE